MQPQLLVELDARCPLLTGAVQRVPHVLLKGRAVDAADVQLRVHRKPAGMGTHQPLHLPLQAAAGDAVQVDDRLDAKSIHAPQQVVDVGLMVEVIMRVDDREAGREPLLPPRFQPADRPEISQMQPLIAHGTPSSSRIWERSSACFILSGAVTRHKQNI